MAAAPYGSSKIFRSRRRIYGIIEASRTVDRGIEVSQLHNVGERLLGQDIESEKRCLLGLLSATREGAVIVDAVAPEAVARTNTSCVQGQPLAIYCSGMNQLVLQDRLPVRHYCDTIYHDILGHSRVCRRTLIRRVKA